MARDEQKLSSAVEQSAALLTSAGFPRMPARTLMALMVAENGLTAAELAESLGVSAAAISGAVRYLQTVGIVHRISDPGSRRDRYEMPEHAWYSILAGRSPLYTSLASLADAAAGAIDSPGSTATQRLDEMARFYRFFDDKTPEIIAQWNAVKDL